MSSASKTANLKLNSWLTTDRPNRNDFNNDNKIIDNQLGGHILNTNIHTTAAEREVASRPVEVKLITGTGSEDLDLGAAPNCNLVVAFRLDHPPMVEESGQIHCYAACWAKDSAGAVRGAGGVAVVNGVTHLYSRTVGNKIYHLNDEGAQVVLLHFRCAT